MKERCEEGGKRGGIHDHIPHMLSSDRDQNQSETAERCRRGGGTILEGPGQIKINARVGIELQAKSMKAKVREMGRAC